MKAVSGGLATHLADTTTTLASCWRVQRRDGTVYGFTDHDRDLVVAGTTYVAAVGYQRAAISSRAELSVDETELVGLIDGSTVTVADLEAGRWDGAEVRIVLANWANPGQGELKMRRGILGEASIADDGTWRAEIRGLTQWLQQEIGELYTPECRADFGDQRCRMPVRPALRTNATAYALNEYVRVETNGAGTGSYKEQRRIYRCTTPGTSAGSLPTFNTTPGQTTADGSVVWTAEEALTRAYTVATSADRETLTLVADDAALAGYTDARFTAGVLVFESGANAGIVREVLTFVAASRTVRLFTPAPSPIAPGDVLRLQAACDKQLDTCIAYQNRLNFRGEPFIPGLTSLIQTPIA